MSAGIYGLNLCTEGEVHVHVQYGRTGQGREGGRQSQG